MSRSTATRREFLRGCAGAMTAMSVMTLPNFASAGTSDVRITRIVGFDLRSKRSKVAGRNARLDVHGDSAVDPMVRIYTSDPMVEGLGVCRAPKEKLAELIGVDPLGLFDAENRRMRGPLGSQTMPLWDLVARMQDKPVCELIGAPAGAHRVPAYDGSIYFADLLPDYAGAWEDRFKREIDMGVEAGHRAFKIKVGRGAKWMSREPGDDRDVAVVQLIRKHAGPEVLLGVDANNGYDLAGAKRFVERVADVKLAFTEELFPEVVEQCLDLKAFYRSRGMDTLLADGETADIESYKPFIAARAIDVLQADMNRFGVEGILHEADLARPQGIRVAPHNWGSLIGFYYQLHVGAAIDNFYRAENDPLTSDVLVTDGYTIKEGYATLPQTSGFGLRVNEERFASDVKVTFDLS